MTTSTRRDRAAWALHHALTRPARRLLAANDWALATQTRCPAPTRAEGGVLRCITTRSRCDEPGHRRYDRVALLAHVVWAIKPWWPNDLGRAQDVGLAHTPHIHPCRHCERTSR